MRYNRGKAACIAIIVQLHGHVGISEWQDGGRGTRKETGDLKAQHHCTHASSASAVVCRRLN
jgi:hypothetical protein